MRYIAGIDIGNSSTEVALATVDDAGVLNIRHSALAETTGIKGTLRNVFGIQEALTQAAKAAGIQVSDISLIRINEATPVIGDVAMETITETIITESTMIGHNPKTPGGVGAGCGGDHVAGVLLMARRVANDELARFGREVAVGHVDGDALLALGRQTVGQQGQVGLATALHARQVVLQHGLAVDQQAADQRALAVVHAAASDELEGGNMVILAASACVTCASCY